LGVLSAPTTAATWPVLTSRLRTLELSLSAMSSRPLSTAWASPDGCAKPAARGYELLRFSSRPLPASAQQLPLLYTLRNTTSVPLHATLSYFRDHCTVFTRYCPPQCLADKFSNRDPLLEINLRGAFDSAKNHKRQRRKRQSVTAKREK